jgi:hypothetical protein
MNCLVIGCWVIVICNSESYGGNNYLDGMVYNTYDNQYPEVGYWILMGDTRLWILVSQLDTEKKYKFQVTYSHAGKPCVIFF